MGVLAAKVARVRGLHVLLRIGDLLALAAGEQLGHPLGEVPAGHRGLPLKPQQSVVFLEQPLPQPHPADRTGRRRGPGCPSAPFVPSPYQADRLARPRPA